MKSSHTRWYNENVATYQGLTAEAIRTLKKLLKDESIDYLAVTGRTKTHDSTGGKLSRKGHSNPLLLNDISGVRVIAYIESDLEKISSLIKHSFEWDEKQSIDKSLELDADRIGYRSVHFICELGEARTNLPELSAYKGLRFEVQVRTVLQHAWAEIEHDRNYKFAGTLPTHIRRRLNLIAATLELADREFSAVAKDVDEYSKDLRKRGKAGRLATEKINSLSFAEFVATHKPIARLMNDAGFVPTSCITELKAFGINTIKQLSQLLSLDFITFFSETEGRSTTIGVLRSAMMYADIDKYFKDAWQESWKRIDTQFVNAIKKRYGPEKYQEIKAQNGLQEDWEDMARE